MLKKLINLVKNYDKIMELVEKSNIKPEKPKKDKKYSMFNTPKSQIDYIANKKGGY